MAQTKDQQDDQATTSSPKKQYQAPKLETLGSFIDLTQGSMSVGLDDGF